jgi:DNA polymerase epsilon subunit 1
MFRNVGDLLAVRKDIMPLALANSAKLTAVDAYAEVVHADAAGKNVYFDGDDETMAWGLDVDGGIAKKESHDSDPRDGIIDIREFDVPYYLRVAIDNGVSRHPFYRVFLTFCRCSCRSLVQRHIRGWSAFPCTNSRACKTC